MNTNDADLLYLFGIINYRTKIDIVRRLLQNKENKINDSYSSSEEDKAISVFTTHVCLLLLPTFEVSDLYISKNEFRVLTYILEYMKFGNHDHPFSQSPRVKATGTSFPVIWSNILKTQTERNTLQSIMVISISTLNIFAKRDESSTGSETKEQVGATLAIFAQR